MASLTTELSNDDLALIGRALHQLRAHLDRRAEATERRLALPYSDPKYVADQARRSKLRLSVIQDDQDVEKIVALYNRLNLNGHRLAGVTGESNNG